MNESGWRVGDTAYFLDGWELRSCMIIKIEVKTKYHGILIHDLPQGRRAREDCLVARRLQGCIPMLWSDFESLQVVRATKGPDGLTVKKVHIPTMW